MLDALLIVVMQFVLVPLTTLRTIFLVKSEIRNASLLGGVEALIYVISLGIIFSDLSNYLNMFAYAIGYSGGIILGGYIEKKLAIGYRTVNVSLLDKTPELIESLRHGRLRRNHFPQALAREGGKRSQATISW